MVVGNGFHITKGLDTRIEMPGIQSVKGCLTVLRLTVEGPDEKVRAFLKDFSILPQHKVLATSVPYEDDELAKGEVQIVCHFRHIPLQEINEPVSVWFKTSDGKGLIFTLLTGNVIRIGDTISITGKATSGMLE